MGNRICLAAPAPGGGNWKKPIKINRNLNHIPKPITPIGGNIRATEFSVRASANSGISGSDLAKCYAKNILLGGIGIKVGNILKNTSSPAIPKPINPIGNLRSYVESVIFSLRGGMNILAPVAVGSSKDQTEWYGKDALGLVIPEKWITEDSATTYKDQNGRWFNSATAKDPGPKPKE